jgi:small subunit ribosomal protein S20
MCDGFATIARVFVAYPAGLPRPGCGIASGTISPPAPRAFLRMPNIKQQKKRVRVAAQERLENLRYRSTVKTLTRRLQAAVEEGDQNQVAEQHVELQRWIDKAVSRGALHRNAGARKKAQAARLARGDS